MAPDVNRHRQINGTSKHSAHPGSDKIFLHSNTHTTHLIAENTTQQFYDTLWTLLKSDFQTSSGNGLFEKFYLLILLSLSTSLIGSFSAILLTSFWRALRNWSLISLNARQMNLILSKSILIKILLSKFWCVRITHLGLFGYPPPCSGQLAPARNT